MRKRLKIGDFRELILQNGGGIEDAFDLGSLIFHRFRIQMVHLDIAFDPETRLQIFAAQFDEGGHEKTVIFRLNDLFRIDIHDVVIEDLVARPGDSRVFRHQDHRVNKIIVGITGVRGFKLGGDHPINLTVFGERNRSRVF